MFFRQIIHEDLGCASYVVADSGEAIVVDPKWVIDDYLTIAAEARASIMHIGETHFHADHVSGRSRLADATGAAAHVPAEPGRPDAGGLSDGDVITVGNAEIRVLAAPGHRPEHLAFLVTDVSDPEATPKLLAGDSLLIGELARPDLAVDADAGARELFGTAKRLTALGDSVELWPGHVGASLCGSGALTDETSSTIGAELARNRLLGIANADEFAAEINRSVPARPGRVPQVVALNVAGARAPRPWHELDDEELAAAVVDGACVVDLRAPEVFDDAHLRGAINLPFTAKGVGTRAGWVSRDEDAIVLVVPSREVGVSVVDRLLAAGVWNLAGVTLADPAAWEQSGLAVRSTVALRPDELASRLSSSELVLIDVRDANEWEAGHVRDSLHLPLSVLRDGTAAVSGLGDRPLAVACAHGQRAAVAASVLRRHGRLDVVRVLGGIGDLADRGVALVSETLAV
jgi:glyoxylase-like metal-dependent hydrolase (beta-lactamase superfamily II)/rhodanese-related sulfurtransferase